MPGRTPTGLWTTWNAIGRQYLRRRDRLRRSRRCRSDSETQKREQLVRPWNGQPERKVAALRSFAGAHEARLPIDLDRGAAAPCRTYRGLDDRRIGFALLC